MQETVSHRIHLIQKWLKNTSPRFLRRLKAESLEKCPRSSTGQSPAFWLLCLNFTNFSRTHRYGRTLEPFGEHSGTQTWKTRNKNRIVHRMILILKWDPPSVNPAIQVTQNQTRLLTAFNRKNSGVNGV